MRRRSLSTIVRRMAFTAGITFFVWWLIRQYLESQKEHPEYPISLAVKEQGKDSAVPVTHVEMAQDNLEMIEGIGPKIAGVLSSVGMVSFAELAATEIEELRRILSDGGVRIAFPETWPEQAALAAAGEWEELELLQSQLVRGRRIQTQG